MTHRTKCKIIDWFCNIMAVGSLCVAIYGVAWLSQNDRRSDFTDGARWGCLETVENYYKILDECLSNNTELYCTNKLYKERIAKGRCTSTWDRIDGELVPKY